MYTNKTIDQVVYAINYHLKVYVSDDDILNEDNSYNAFGSYAERDVIRTSY